MLDWEGMIGWELIELLTRKKTRQETLQAIMVITEDMKAEWEEELKNEQKLNKNNN